MTNDKDKIKELFSDKLKDFQPEVPASLWAAIDDSLSQQKVEVVAIPVKTKKSFVLRTVTTVASIAAILIAVIVMFDIFTPAHDNIESEIAEVLESPIEKEQDIAESIKPVIAQTVSVETKKSSLKQQTRSIFSSSKPDKSNSEIISLSVSSEQSDVSVENPTTVEEKEEVVAEVKESQEKEERQITSKEAEEILLRQSNGLVAENEKVESITKKKDKFSLALSSNSNFQRKDISKQGGTMTMRQKEEESFIGVNMYGGSNDFDIKHDQPISFSIGVSKGIAPNLSLETGIVYTYLSSSISSKSTVDMKEKQKFHYLGIPLNLNYTFFRHRRFSSYITIGGMIEKDIKGTTRGNINGLFDNYSTGINYQITDMSKSIKQSHPQLSAHSSLGVSYLLYNRLSVYGNVGAAYYFDASNEYRTIYSDREFQLDLNLGFRWNF